MANDSINYEIIQHVCVLNEKNNGWRRELNVVKWNGGAPKLDIRDWSYDRSSMSKGVTLGKPEVMKMQKALKYLKLGIFDGPNPVTGTPVTIQVTNNPVAEAEGETQGESNATLVDFDSNSEEITKEKIASGE